MNRRQMVEWELVEIAECVDSAKEWWEYKSTTTGKSLVADLLDAIDRIYGVLPDDGEQIDLNWIRKVCNHEDYGVAPGCFCVLSDGQAVRVRKDATRGRFRRLCEALGVELKERKDGE